MTDPTLQERIEKILDDHIYRSPDEMRQCVRELRAKVAELESINAGMRDSIKDQYVFRAELEARLAVPIPEDVQKAIQMLLNFPQFFSTDGGTHWLSGPHADPELVKAAALLESQARRIAELEKDAARYRWLRESGAAVDDSGLWKRNRRLDYTIDAALQASAEAELRTGNNEGVGE